MKKLKSAIAYLGILAVPSIFCMFYILAPYHSIGRTREIKKTISDSYKTIFIQESIRQKTKSEDVPNAEILQYECKSCDSNNTNSKIYEYFSGKFSLDKPPLSTWVEKGNILSFCDNRGTVYSDSFGILHDVTLFPSRRERAESQAKGGEEIKAVLNQKLDKEYYKFNKDFLEMECSETAIKEPIPQKLLLLNSLKLIPLKKMESTNLTVKSLEKYVIAVRRQDYANLHNWVRNIYNTFITLMHFRIQPKEVTILFIDGHPRTELDNAWTIIYNQPLRVGQLPPQPVKIHNFILGLEENKGPITEFRNGQVPFLEDFRTFVLSQFNLSPAEKLDCYKPRITVIIRRNAIYHPRNVVGNVGRKIFNEAELVNDLMKAFPNASVRPTLLEALPMVSQLDLIKDTDILIGMHGAGMSHVMFLPKHAAVLELFAKDFKKGRPWFICFHSITKWRNLHYDSWENFDKSLEISTDFTILPTRIIVNKARLLMSKLCPAK